MADGALDRGTTAKTPRAPSRAPTAMSRRSTSPSKSDAESWATRLHGACCRPAPCARSLHGPVTHAARLRRGRMVGAGRRRGACRRGCSATSRANPSPIFAPRRAARPRSLRRPARRSPRSIARRRGWRGCRKISRGCHSPPNRRGRCRRMGARARSMRPARCALLVDRHHPPPSRTSPWLKHEADSRSSPPCNSACSTARVTLLKPGGTLVYCTCSLEPEEGEQADRRAAGRRAGSCAASRSRPARSPALSEFITADGDLRTLPCHLARRRPANCAGSTASMPHGWSRDLNAATPLSRFCRRREASLLCGIRGREWSRVGEIQAAWR